VEKEKLPLLIGRNRVEAEYGLSIDLQDKLRDEGALPSLKLGRRVFYYREDLDRYLHEQRAKSMSGDAHVG
jgi:hypothetical protein